MLTIIYADAIYVWQAAGGIISASLLSTPGASGFYKGGLTVRHTLAIPSQSLEAAVLIS